MGKKVAIVGGYGQLGRQLQLVYDDAWVPTRQELDVTTMGYEDFGKLSQFDLVINCAAMHNLRACHESPQEAFAVNCMPQGMLGAVCKKLIYISTNYVFDGMKDDGDYLEHDCTRPLNVYGMTKLAGELSVLGYRRHLIIRTAGLYGPGGPSGKGMNFVDAVRSGQYKAIKDDEFINPTSCADLARAIKDHDDYLGILHMVNQPAMSWYEFAKMISTDVEPVSRNNIQDGLSRPKNGGMKSLYHLGMMSVKDALGEYLSLT